MRFFPAALSDGTLRQVAMVCMLIDHFAWAFLPSGSVPAGILHTFGRITAPVICFLLTEGYRHTHSFRKYLTRMMIFTAVSYFPYLDNCAGKRLPAFLQYALYAEPFSGRALDGGAYP